MDTVTNVTHGEGYDSASAIIVDVFERQGFRGYTFFFSYHDAEHLARQLVHTLRQAGVVFPEDTNDARCERQPLRPSPVDNARQCEKNAIIKNK